MDNCKKLLESFKYAFKGVARTVKAERNLRIHITVLIYMFSILCFTDWFVLSRTDYAVLVVVSGLVIASEIINTAIENAVNLASEEFDRYAEISKDAAAGAVLVCAIFAVITGLVLLFQPEAFRAMYFYFKENILMAVLVALSLIPATIFVFFGFGPYKRK